MKTKFLLFIGMLATAFACNDDNITTIQTTLDGQYTGVFERNGEEVTVQLNFENGTFNGESEMQRYPAICNGDYAVSENNTISFENKCMWTADFDWTLILTGDWTYELQNNTLTLTKENGDTYTLTKRQQNCI